MGLLSNYYRWLQSWLYLSLSSRCLKKTTRCIKHPDPFFSDFFFHSFSLLIQQNHHCCNFRWVKKNVGLTKGREGERGSEVSHDPPFFFLDNNHTAHNPIDMTTEIILDLVLTFFWQVGSLYVGGGKGKRSSPPPWLPPFLNEGDNNIIITRVRKNF